MTRRWPPLLLIAALLVGGLVVGRDEPAPPARPPTDPTTLLPVAAPADALGSIWFCAGQSAGEGTVADGTLVIANVGDRLTRGQVDVVTDTGETAQLDIEIPALTTRRVRLAEIIEADWVAARVELDRGEVAVEHEVVGPQGRDVAACQTTAADRLHLPSGATTRDATLRLAIYNPYPGSATVDIAFATTETRRRAPADFQGIPVPARSLVVVDVTPVVTVVPVAAATITTRRGRVVVDRIQTYDGRGSSTTDEEAAEQAYAAEGLALTPAVRTPRPVWAFPAGVRSAGVHERVVVANPGDTDAEVEIELALHEPERNGVLDPFPLTVPAGEFAVFDVDEAEAVPENITHSLVVRSIEGGPVVAERWIDSVAPDGSYVAVATSTGSPVAAPGWVFAAGRRGDDTERQRIVLSNPGTDDVEVTLTATGRGERIDVGGPVTVPAGGRVDVPIDDLPERLSIVVGADGPVVAERRLISVGTAGTEDTEADPGIGASVTIGIPLADGLLLLR